MLKSVNLEKAVTFRNSRMHLLPVIVLSFLPLFSAQNGERNVKNFRTFLEAKKFENISLSDSKN